MFVIPTSNTNEEQPSDLEEMINDYDYNNPNDSQNLIPEPYEVQWNRTTRLLFFSVGFVFITLFSF